PQRQENAGAGAGGQEDQGEVSRQPGAAVEGPAGAIQEAQRQPVRRLPADAVATAHLPGPLSGAGDRYRTASGPADSRHGLVLEPVGPRQAVLLGALPVAVARRRNGVAGPLLQLAAGDYGGAVLRASKAVHAAGDRRPAEADAAGD